MKKFISSCIKTYRKVWGCFWGRLSLKFPEGSVCNFLRKFLFMVEDPIRHDPSCFVRPGENVVFAGMWRAETLDAWARQIRAGANKDVKKDGQLIVIEASPKSCEILRFEAERRMLDNVRIINSGLWSEPKELIFQIKRMTDANIVKDTGTYKKSSGKDRNYDAIENPVEEIRINADTLDNLLRDLDIDKIDHIHITIGGSEVEAVKGMKKILSRKNFRLYCRSIRNYEESNEALSSVVKKLLEEGGMKCYSLDKAGQRIYAFFK